MPAPTPRGLETLEDRWHSLTEQERSSAFAKLRFEKAAGFFALRAPATQATLLDVRPIHEQQLLVRLLPPDDLASLLRHIAPARRESVVSWVDERTRAEVTGLLAHAEDAAGGRMNPRFVRLRPQMTLQEATAYTIKRTREQAETLRYLYVLDEDQRLLGVVSLRDLLTGTPASRVSDIMQRDVVTIHEDAGKEAIARLATRHALAAVPVVSHDGRMVGIVTLDDVLNVVQAEATEDIQKLGATSTLPRSYLQSSIKDLFRARAGWLVLLFFGEILAAFALARFEGQLHRTLILALFIPLIIACGGNAGAQATALVVRDMALGKLRASDLAKTLRRESIVSLALGMILAVMGAARIAAGTFWGESVPEDAARIALVIGTSLIIVVILGSLVGTILPFALSRLGFDPATASGPLVATLVDVAGIVAYFSVATLIL